MLSLELPVWPHIWPFLWCVSICFFFLSSLVAFPSFLLPSLVRAKISSNAQTSRVGIHPLPLTQALYEIPPFPLCHELLNIFTVLYTKHPGWQEGMVINLPLLCNVSQMLNYPLPPFLQSRIVGVMLCTLLQQHKEDLRINIMQEELNPKEWNKA